MPHITKSHDHRRIPAKADVVIVGAGVAGLYCAWRLLRQKPARRVVIIERLNRTGGRLDTDLIKIKNARTGKVETIREEEGGMRFTYDMKELMSLFQALGLCEDIVPFPMDGKNRRNYFRGHSFTVEEAAADDNAIWAEIYNLAPAERDQSPTELLGAVYQRILVENNQKQPKYASPRYWQRFRLDFKWKGVTLNRWTLWGLLRDMGYTEECIKMLAHTIGFEGPYLSLMNAGEAFQLLEDFPASPDYHTFRDGFSTLPNALVKQVTKMGAKIYLSTNVDAIEAAPRGGFKVRYKVAARGTNARMSSRGKQGSIVAPQLILAVARKALETIFVTSPVLRDGRGAEKLWQALQTTTNQRLCKINLYYEEAWWDNQKLTGQPPIDYGPSFTDLPANTVYPFYPLSGPTPDNPASLTIYCDYNNTNFWQGLQSVGPKFDSPLQKEHSKRPQTLFPASEAVVEEATRQFRELFNTHWVPRPVMTSFRLWDGEGDFGYAVHQWALDANDRPVMRLLAEPIPSLYTCNEAYSDMQGWVNGSLRSAELVLAKFGLDSIADEPRCGKQSKQEG